MQKNGAAGAGRSADGGNSGDRRDGRSRRSDHLKLVYSSDWEQHAGDVPPASVAEKRPDLTMMITLAAAVIGLTLPMFLWMWLGYAP